jgi:hypothetical protein
MLLEKVETYGHMFLHRTVVLFELVEESKGTGILFSCFALLYRLIERKRKEKNTI